MITIGAIEQTRKDTKSGLSQRARWISLCWGDYDGDGRQDLLAASFDQGPFLFRNLGDGRFEDVSVKAGIRTQTHAYTPEFFDFDNDGILDLFVSTYPKGDLQVKDMIEAHLTGVAPSSQRQLLFRNNGTGRSTMFRAKLASRVGMEACRRRWATLIMMDSTKL